MTDVGLGFLVDWFAAHCDGDWEHDLGIRIETLDNPGWALDVRLEDTELQGVTVAWQRHEESPEVWLHWRSTGHNFEARCGPRDLGRAFAAFKWFVETATRDTGEFGHTANEQDPPGGL